jgi:hypothetical protein
MRFSKFNCAVYNFDDVDVEKLHILIPHATIMNYSFKNIFEKYLDKYSVRKTLSFDNILYSHTDKYLYTIDYIIKLFGQNFYYLNYYGRFYNIHPRTRLLLNDYDLKLTQSIEKFENIKPSNILFAPKSNLKGFYNSDTQLFTINDTFIEGTPLKTGDAVSLLRQSRIQENGKYIVQSTDKTKSLSVLKRLDGYKPVEPSKDEKDPRYICTDSTIKIKELCKSKYDTTGNLKRFGTADVWDRPCDYDEECPFYQKNTTYKNYRGGCISGHCEMPIGVKRIAFRNYEGTPLCHSCDNPQDKNCCANQKQPNYAFPLDDYERLPTVKETFIQDPTLPVDYNYSGEENEKNIYHYEYPAEEIDKKLKSLIHKRLQVIQESNGQVQFDKVLTKPLNDCFDRKDREYRIYDIHVLCENETDDMSSTTYSIECTLYRPNKSHGKRLFIQLKKTSREIEIVKIKILGIVPEQDITELHSFIQGKETNTDYFSYPQFFSKISDDPIFVMENSKTFLCDRSKKLKQEFNIDTPCP